MIRLALALCALIAAPALAAPTDISATIRATKPGATVTAPAGPLVLSLNKATFSPSITIRGGEFDRIEVTNGGGIVFADAVVRPATRPKRGAAVYLANVADVTFVDSTIAGSDYGFNGLNLLTGRRVAIVRTSFAGLANGLRARDADDLTVQGSTFTDLNGDGVGITAARGVLIDGNWLAWGERGRIGHPDAIQIWDSKGTVTADIAITRNVIRVFSQGVFVKGEGHSGFDRVTIADNDVAVDYVNGIVLTNSRDSIVRSNRVRTLTGRKNVAKLGLHNNVGLTLTANSACQMYETAPSTFSAKAANVTGADCTPIGLTETQAAAR